MEVMFHPLQNHFIQCQEKQKYFPSPCFLSVPHIGFTRREESLLLRTILKGREVRAGRGKGDSCKNNTFSVLFKIVCDFNSQLKLKAKPPEICVD
jgi:hypothetical protein